MVRIAIEGCCHGELDKIYDTIQHINNNNNNNNNSARHNDNDNDSDSDSDNMKISLLICCGDFQSVRDDNDLKVW